MSGRGAVLRVGIAVPLSLLCIAEARARDLDFAERVAAQAAIERVYHAHRVGASLPFEQAVTQDLLEHKVRTYLLQSAALAELWDTPVTAEALERELLRIARDTRLPDRLDEIYDALGRDPFLIQECFVRPVLVGRLARGFFAGDPRIHGEAHARAEALRGQIAAGVLDPTAKHPDRTLVEIVRSPGLDATAFERMRAHASGLGEVGPVIEEADAFVVNVTLRLAAERVLVACYRVRKIAWDRWWEQVAAGVDPVVPVALEGAKLPAPGRQAAGCPRLESWENESLDDLPGGRNGHTAVWTGSEMIVWGGRDGTGPFSAGGRYAPQSDTWLPTSTTGAPTARSGHTAVWTGSEMIVWGGWGGPAPSSHLNTGGRYDPSNDDWTATPATGAPAPRSLHTAVWTGDEMIVWGGFTAGPAEASGGRYSPGNDTWSPTTLVGAPSPRGGHKAVWTGTETIVLGGEEAGGTGGRYRLVQTTDTDADGFCSDVDCDDADDQIWAVPGETTGLLFEDEQTLVWVTPSAPGASALSYDTIRSGQASDFVASTTCMESDDGTDTRASDGTVPSEGSVFYYLVRAQNACPSGQGPLGTASSGAPRVARSCP